jgi:cytidylate kinase
MSKPVELSNIRNITISGRIGAGATTLAKKLSGVLHWDVLEGGDLFEKIHKELKLDQSMVSGRPDHFDLEYEEKVKKMLTTEANHIIQSHLAGFDAQGIPNIFKICIVCEDERGSDKTEIRIDRLINRDKVSLEEAKKEVLEREKQHLGKWIRLYAGGDQKNKKYYDLVINTYSHNQDETLKLALQKIGYK